MRHRKRTIKLGRKSAHRESMLANMVCSLIQEKQIKTTLAKAKAARILAEKMVTLGKRNNLATRRKAISSLRSPNHVKVLFDEIAPGFAQRQGGYTRIIKLGKRTSDSSEMALLEWVEFGEPAKKTTKKASKPVQEEKEDMAEDVADEADVSEEKTEDVAEAIETAETDTQTEDGDETKKDA